MKKLLPLILILCLLGGCSAAAPDSAGAEQINIYRVYAGDEAGELLQPEALTLSADSRSDVETALSLFTSEPRASGLRAALPADISVLSYTQTDGLVTLDLSDNFLALSPVEQSTAAFAAVLTLCGLEDVEAVSITAGGQTVFQGLNSEDVLLQDSDSDPYTRRLRLYFASEDGRWLTSEYHSLSLDEDSSLERYVMEELLRGPNDSSLKAAVPAGTELLSCSTDDGVCTVDLSEEFLSGKPDTALGERLAIWSVVNSLTVLSDVDSVQILCEGETVGTYLYRSLAQPLSAFKEAIGPADTAKGESDALLFVALPDLKSVAAMPYVIDIGAYDSELDALLDALVQSAEPGYPQLFFGSGTILSASLKNSICTVDLSDGFFASLSAEERSAAVQCLAATVLQLDGCREVRLTLSGEEAVFEGVSYAGPWTAENINIAE